MANRYDRDERDRGDNPTRYRDEEGRQRQYGGDYEGGRDFEREQETAPGGRYGQGRSESRFGQQGWQRQQEPGQPSRASDWSRRPDEGEWQRQQQWELQQSRQNIPYTERAGQQGGYRQAGSEPARQARGGAYGAEYPESSYRSPGGYGEMYRGDTRQYTSEGSASMYEPERRIGSTAGPYAGRGPKGYQRSDERIKEDVCERLTRHDEVDAEDIDVQVRNGEVTLTGSVMDRYQKRLAEDALEGVTGVRDINNQLRAGSGGQGQGQLTTAGGGYAGAPTGRGSSAPRTTPTKPASRTSGTRGSTSSRGSTTSRSGTGRSGTASPANRPLAGSPPSATRPNVSTPGGQSPEPGGPTTFSPPRQEP